MMDHFQVYFQKQRLHDLSIVVLQTFFITINQSDEKNGGGEGDVLLNQFSSKVATVTG